MHIQHMVRLSVIQSFSPPNDEQKSNPLRFASIVSKAD